MSQLGCLHSSLSGRQLVCRTERQPAVQRHTLQIVSKDSRIGKAPVTVPKGVTVTLKECHIHVKVGCSSLSSRVFVASIALQSIKAPLCCAGPQGRASADVPTPCRHLPGGLTRGAPCLLVPQPPLCQAVAPVSGGNSLKRPGKPGLFQLSGWVWSKACIAVAGS